MEISYPWNRKSLGDPAIKKPEICMSCGAILVKSGWKALPNKTLMCNMCNHEIYGKSDIEDSKD